MSGSSSWPGGSLRCDGVYIGSADFNGDGVSEVVSGTNRQGGPLRVFQIGAGVSELTSFYPYFEGFIGPVHVASLGPDRGPMELEQRGAMPDLLVAQSRVNGPTDVPERHEPMVPANGAVGVRERSPPPTHDIGVQVCRTEDSVCDPRARHASSFRPAAREQFVGSRLELGMIERHDGRLETGLRQKPQPIRPREQPFHVAIVFDADRAVAFAQDIGVVDHVRGIDGSGSHVHSR